MDTVQGSWPQSGASVAHPVEPLGSEAAPRRALGALGFLADAMRRRRSGRIALWGLVVALAVSGVSLMAWPFVTDFWAGRIQDGLRQDFAALEAGGDPGTNAYPTQLVEGKALTRLRIPELGVSVIVVEGVSGNALRAGAGHFPESALPGEPSGNVAIAGHRTGYGEPFRDIDKLDPGDKIWLDTPFGKFLYAVMPGSPFVVKPTDIWVKAPTADHVVTLVTCDPPHTSKNRLIVRARFVREVN